MFFIVKISLNILFHAGIPVCLFPDEYVEQEVILWIDQN